MFPEDFGTLSHFIHVVQHASRGVMRGAQCPGGQITGEGLKSPSMSQVLSSVQYICSERPQVEIKYGCAMFISCPGRHLTLVLPWVQAQDSNGLAVIALGFCYCCVSLLHVMFAGFRTV